MGLNLDGSSNVQVQRLKDMHPVEEQEKLLQWADQYYAAHPYIPPEEVSRMLKAERDAKMDSPALIKQYMYSTHEQITGLTSMVGSVFNILSHGLPHVSSNIPPTTSQLPSSLVSMQSPSVSPTSSIPTISPTSLSSSTSAPLPPMSVSPSTSVPMPPTPSSPSTSVSRHSIPLSMLAPPSTSVLTPSMPWLSTLPLMTSTPSSSSMLAPMTSMALSSTLTPVTSLIPTIGPITLLAPPSVENDVMMTNTSSFSSTLRDNNITIADISPSALPSMVRKAHCSVEEKSFEIILANQKLLRFKYHDIPEPSLQLSFTHDIARLDRIWDDKGSHWDPMDCATVSSINGVPVALCYWQQIYKGKKDQHWDGIKGMWSEWRYVAERYWSITPEQFWSEFQTNAGEQMNWTAILERLQELRINRNEELAERAKAEYGPRFPELFSYRGKVMSKSSSIASRYLSLKNVT
ncbi:hypothetical protein C8R41DRAFT_963939, partial [Lentinula lateritia]